MQTLNNSYRFQGFINTPNLWENDEVYGLPQFHIEPSGKPYKHTYNKPLRLGKLVERFLIHELQQRSHISIISENHQVQDGTLTLGELDCLLLLKNIPIHLEIVYKFYLYDASVGTTILDHWIGPNRRDSLVKKLNKLKEKQLPLLHHPITKSWVKSLGYHSEKFGQLVCFKAQLFLPYADKDIDITPLNQTCIQGYYLTPSQLSEFKDCKFYIPKKLDWLMDIPIHIDWLTFEAFRIKLNEFLAEKSAPLCWVKRPNGETLKLFVVWW
ncbi:DUF1853 family protein [Winogradskyella sp. 3972H.M.0a.05]|uniref:DUF1853 family protein n=1 Tax=Winogradskyella sp. 3972H.M.0a.05 TaxID=2950277 RepID=UPI00339AF10A